jgi:adenylate cyclase
VRLFLDATRDPRIVVVDIDEKSLNAEGHWPWGRDKLALLLRQLFEKHRVRVVGFDVAFPEADGSSGLPVLESIANAELKDNAPFQAFLQRARASLDYDRIFADEIAKRPVVLGFLLGAKDQSSGVLPPPAFPAAALAKAEFRHFAATGHSGNTPLLQRRRSPGTCIPPRPDGITRSVPMFMRVRRLLRGDVARGPAHLPRQRTCQLRHDGRRVRGCTQGWIRFVRVGDQVRVPLDYRMTALVPYRDKAAHRYVSATDVLRGSVGAD